MKKLVLLFTVFVSVVSFGAVEYDLKKGIDLTGAVSVNGSQLNQLVDAGTLATNKGLIIRQAATPDTTLNPRYTNYMWLDISAGLPGVMKVWNGSAWSTNIVGSGQIGTTNIANGSITTAKLANGAVNTININDGAVTDVKISAGAITSSKIANGSVSNNHIALATIDATRLAPNAIATASIADSSVTSNKLASSSVTPIKIADGAVTSTKIPDGAVVAGKLNTGSVSMSNIVASITNLLPKAFVTFTASAAPAILGVAHNISGVARVSAGIYTLTFTSALANTNYIISGTSVGALSRYSVMTVGNFRAEVRDATGTAIDSDLPTSIVVFQNQ